MRLKCRFLICQLDFGANAANSSEGPLAAVDVYMAVKNSMQETWGDAGWARASRLLAVKFWDPQTRVALVRAPLDQQREVRAALALIKAVKKRPAAVRVVQVCGSERSVQSALRRWYRELPLSSSRSAALLASLGEDGELPAQAASLAGE
jgi:ribonuclease P/MRP protein subunit POP5